MQPMSQQGPQKSQCLPTSVLGNVCAAGVIPTLLAPRLVMLTSLTPETCHRSRAALVGLRHTFSTSASNVLFSNALTEQRAWEGRGGTIRLTCGLCSSLSRPSPSPPHPRQVVFSLASGNIARAFDIVTTNYSIGEVFVARPLDREELDHYILKVRNTP